MSSSSLRKYATGAAGIALFGIALVLASPRDLWAQLRHVSLGTAAAVTLLAIANLAVVAFRFWRVLRHCSVVLPWGTAWRACMAGNLASLAFIPLLAQVAGRQAVLHRMGVSPITTASVSALERVLLAGTSALAACVGAAYLLGREALHRFTEELALGQLSVVVGLTAIVVFGCTRSAFESDLIRRTLSRRVFFASLETLGVTVIGHALIVLAFVVAFSALGTPLSTAQLIAGAAIVSFAASLPLSVGGWGIRELAAVMVFGQMGVDAATAMAGSVAVGLCSTLAIFITSTSVLRRRASDPSAISTDPSMSIDRHDTERSASWLLGMTTAALVFFQVHLSLNGHTINVNVGDPFAMLALAAVALLAISQRSMPTWTMAGFNTWLACFSGALLLSFAVGVFHHGVTPWALGNKLTGWLVLLGYLGAGYLLARDHRDLGVLRMVEVALVVVCAIVWVKVVIRGTPWFPGQLAMEPANFEGFSGNRNAFAFQLCAVLAMALGHIRPLMSRFSVSRGQRFALILGVGTVLAGVVLTGSRTGMGVAAVLLAVAFVAQAEGRKAILSTLVAAVLIWLLATNLIDILTAIATAAWTVAFTVQQWFASPSAAIPPLPQWDVPAVVGSSFSSETSDHARWAANRAAFEMWLQSPLWGGGLGSFIHGSEARFGSTLTIHSTPVWLLAEFGLAGVAVMGFAAFVMGRHFWRHRPLDSRNLSASLVLLGFGLFAQLHEMLYQRTLWLFLGATLALWVRADHESERT
jgi:uncharacterized membrane protein YbhN (UPF0104 family)